MLYIFGFGTTRLGEWRLNHIHSINGAEVINPSCSDSSAEIDYSDYTLSYVMLCNLTVSVENMVEEDIIKDADGRLHVYTDH